MVVARLGIYLKEYFMCLSLACALPSASGEQAAKQRAWEGESMPSHLLVLPVLSFSACSLGLCVFCFA